MCSYTPAHSASDYCVRAYASVKRDLYIYFCKDLDIGPRTKAQHTRARAYTHSYKSAHAYFQPPYFLYFPISAKTLTLNI